MCVCVFSRAQGLEEVVGLVAEAKVGVVVAEEGLVRDMVWEVHFVAPGVEAEVGVVVAEEGLVDAVRRQVR